jgi:hypothetical protein
MYLPGSKYFKYTNIIMSYQTDTKTGLEVGSGFAVIYYSDKTYASASFHPYNNKNSVGTTVNFTLVEFPAEDFMALLRGTNAETTICHSVCFIGNPAEPDMVPLVIPVTDSLGSGVIASNFIHSG